MSNDSKKHENVLTPARARERLASARSGLLFLTAPETVRWWDALPGVPAVACREATAALAAAGAREPLLPERYGYGFFPALDSIVSVNSRLYTGNFDLYAYQEPMRRCLDDFLALDGRLARYDGEELYVGGEYNLAHHVGAAILYPVDVMCAVLERERPTVVCCADPAGDSLEHHILRHLREVFGFEYHRLAEAEPCAA